MPRKNSNTDDPDPLKPGADHHHHRDEEECRREMIPWWLGQIFDKLCAGGGDQHKIMGFGWKSEQGPRAWPYHVHCFHPPCNNKPIFRSIGEFIFGYITKGFPPILKVQHTKVDLSSTAVTVLRRVFLIAGWLLQWHTIFSSVSSWRYFPSPCQPVIPGECRWLISGFRFTCNT